MLDPRTGPAKALGRGGATPPREDAPRKTRDAAMTPELWERRHARERAAREEAERLLEDKSLELYQANGDLARQLRRISALIDGAPHSILTIEANLRIGDKFSAALPVLIGAPEDAIAGAPAVDLLRRTLDLSADAAARLEDALAVAIDGDMLSWELNCSHLPEEVTLHRRPTRVIETLWTPLVHGSDGRISAVLLSLRDVTREREMASRLAVCDRTHSELMGSLSALLKWPRSRIAAFFVEAEPRMARIERAFAGAASDHDALLLDAHALKAAARAFEFAALVDALHHLEDSIASRAQPSAAKERWDAVAAAYDALRRARDALFGGNDANAAGAFLAATLVAPHLDGARAALREAGWALDTRIEDQLGRVSPEIAAALDAALGHLVTNMVDHSLIPSLTPNAAPMIEVALRSEPDGSVAVRLRDNGLGFDETAIRRRAERAGLTIDPADPFAVLFETGFSTARAVTTRSGRGVGMGAVKHAIAAAGGEIRLIQRPGGGSETQIRLPSSPPPTA